MPRNLLLALLLLAAWPAHPSSQFATGSSATYSLSGTVINSVTGEPIRGALVQIFSGAMRAKLTGPNGEFRFDGLPAGGVGMQVQKPGFFGEQELSSIHQRQSRIVIGPDAEPVILKLYPEGLIFGRVTGENGEPLENLAITVGSKSMRNGRVQWQLHPGGRTDEDGEFRVAELTPGNYYLAAGPSRNAELEETSASKRGPEGYAMAFYPASRELDAATPIKIVPGSRIQADFSLSREPFYRISGTIVGEIRAAGSRASLRNDSILSPTMGLAVDPRTGTFQSGWIPPGPYLLQANSRATNGNSSSASLHLNVAANISNIHMVLEPTLTIPVNFRVESDHQLPENVTPAQVILYSRDAAFRNAPKIARRGGTPGSDLLTVRDVTPGAYSVEIRLGGSWYVQSATYGSTDLLREDLILASGAARQIEIVLRDDEARLEGAIVSGGQKVQGVVLLISDRSPNDPREFSTSSEGNFGFSPLAPGTYRVLAFDRIDDLDYAKPDVLQKFLTKAQEVTLAANQRATINVELMLRGSER